MRPGQLGNMNHAEHAAEINKSAIAGERFDNAGVALADFAILPELLTLRGSLLLEHAADRTNRSLVTSALRYLNQAEVNILSNEILKALITAGSCLGSGNKDTDTVVENDDAALDSLCYLAGKNLLGFNLILKLVFFNKFFKLCLGAFLVVRLHD